MPTTRGNQLKVTKCSHQVSDWAFRRVASHTSIYGNAVSQPLSENNPKNRREVSWLSSFVVSKIRPSRRARGLRSEQIHGYCSHRPYVESRFRIQIGLLATVISLVSAPVRRGSAIAQVSSGFVPDSQSEEWRQVGRLHGRTTGHFEGRGDLGGPIERRHRCGWSCGEFTAEGIPAESRRGLSSSHGPTFMSACFESPCGP